MNVKSNSELVSTNQSTSIQGEDCDLTTVLPSSDNLHKKINDIKQSLIASGSTSMPMVVNKTSVQSESDSNKATTVLAPSEKVSDEAKKYWATLDLYNNSKVAFNKRSKSVRLKREKLNSEWQARFQLNQTQHQTPQKQQQPAPNFKYLEETPVQKHDPQTCKCVKCSIIYHETLIKSVSDMKTSMCRKCSIKLTACKCATSSSSSMASFSDSASIVSNPTETTKKPTSPDTPIIDNINRHPKKSEFNQFDEKLFNIKNELVTDQLSNYTKSTFHYIFKYHIFSSSKGKSKRNKS